MMAPNASVRLMGVLGGEARVREAAAKAGASSVFVYGSQARGDHEVSSDLEVGVVVESQDRDGASVTFGSALEPTIHARYYTFVHEKLRNGSPDVPFTRRIFIAELRDSAVTLFGQPVREIVPSLPIRPGDLFEEHAFVRARVLDGLICARDGHNMTAAALCWKASYMAGRLYVLATEQRLLSNRDQLWDYEWPTQLAGLKEWMKFDRAFEQARGDPGSIRGLSRLLTQDIYGALDNCDRPFHLK